VHASQNNHASLVEWSKAPPLRCGLERGVGSNPTTSNFFSTPTSVPVAYRYPLLYRSLTSVSVVYPTSVSVAHRRQILPDGHQDIPSKRNIRTDRDRCQRDVDAAEFLWTAARAVARQLALVHGNPISHALDLALCSELIAVWQRYSVPTYEKHELLALYEFIQRSGFGVKWIGKHGAIELSPTRDNGAYDQPAALQLTAPEVRVTDV
jgi:hypothetical protein